MINVHFFSSLSSDDHGSTTGSGPRRKQARPRRRSGDSIGHSSTLDLTKADSPNSTLSSFRKSNAAQGASPNQIDDSAPENLSMKDVSSPAINLVSTRTTTGHHSVFLMIIQNMYVSLSRFLNYFFFLLVSRSRLSVFWRNVSPPKTAPHPLPMTAPPTPPTAPPHLTTANTKPEPPLGPPPPPRDSCPCPTGDLTTTQ